MTIGPTVVIRAPGCIKPLNVLTISSGNIFGATFWTDGKREAPMLPDALWLRKSRSEGVLFWMDECIRIGEINHSSGEKCPPEWEDLDFVQDPTEADYLAATVSGIAIKKEQLTYIRLRLWWCGNDPIRRKEMAQLPAQHLENLSELVLLLSEEKPLERMWKAEALRELSRFDESLELLKEGFPPHAKNIFDRIRDLALDKNCIVAKL